MEQEILTQPPLAEVLANVERQGNLLDNYERRFEKQKTTTRPPRRRKSFGETRCKCETNVETVINKQWGLYSDGTEHMDRH